MPGATGIVPTTPGVTPTDTPATPGVTPTATAPGAALPAPTTEPISEACRGFDFTGLVYSPGGEVLPNKCAAFHPTLNNPYAVRCVDAWPWYKTEYPGDNYCILPPPPDKGMQFGHHPQGEDEAWFNAVSKGDMSGYEERVRRLESSPVARKSATSSSSTPTWLATTTASTLACAVARTT